MTLPEYNALIWLCVQAVLIAVPVLFLWEVVVDKIKDSVTGV